MKNPGKKCWLAFLPLFFLLTILAPVRSAYSAPPAAAVTCPTPDVTITDRSAGAVSFSWSAASGATAYKIWYYRSEDHYTSSEITTGNTSVSFSNLPAGTYDFYFATICGGGSSSFIVVDDLIM